MVRKKAPPVLEEMSEEELAGYLYEHRDDESLWGAGSVALPGPHRFVYRMELKNPGIDEVARYVFARGLDLDEFILNAALEKARTLMSEEAASAGDVAPRARKPKA